MIQGGRQREAFQEEPPWTEEVKCRGASDDQNDRFNPGTKVKELSFGRGAMDNVTQGLVTRERGPSK